MVERIRLEEEPTVIEPLRERGRPFQKGNPGRPPGSKNKTTRFLEELVGDEGEHLARQLIDLAKGGNIRCLLFCVERLWPQRRGEPINLELPKIERIQDIAPAMAAVIHAVSNGNITTEQASQIIGVLNSFGNALTDADIAIRLEKVETVLKMQTDKT